MGLGPELTRWWRRLQDLSPRTILLIGFALFVVYAFPGYMSTDSASQLHEARTSTFSDGNPPFMSAEWWVLDRIIAGPILMLLLQGSLFLGGLHVILKRVLTPRAAAWTAIGIFLYPPVLTTMAVIWKDSQMAAYLLAGTAAVIQPRLRTRLIGLGLLAAACALRHNALAAVVPIVVILFEWRPGLRLWKRFAILAAAAVLTVAATCGVSRALTTTHVRLTPVFSDIVGVIAFTHDRTDEDLRHVLRGTTLVPSTDIQADARFLCKVHGAWRLMGGDERMFDYPQTEDQWAAFNRAWRELVLGNPMAYLAYHWDGFARIIGFTDEPLRAPVWNLFLEDQGQLVGADHDASHSWAQQAVGFKLFYWLADDTPLFSAYVYAVVALVLLVLVCRDRLTFALMASGLLYELSFFPVGAEPDYRYSHWMITSVCVAIAILFVQRRRAKAR